jgi:hypothetical protein
MEHIGIDLGSKDSQICVRSADGEIVGEWRWRRQTRHLPAGSASRSGDPGDLHRGFRIAALAQRAGHDVRVVAATLVRSLGVGHRGLKNDVRDARVLSEASCRMDLPSVHIRTAISQEVRPSACPAKLSSRHARSSLDAFADTCVRVWGGWCERHRKAFRNGSARRCSRIPKDYPSFGTGARCCIRGGERADCRSRHRAADAGGS